MHDFLWYSIAGVVRSSTIFKCECATKILFFQHVENKKIFTSQGALCICNDLNPSLFLGTLISSSLDYKCNIALLKDHFQISLWNIILKRSKIDGKRPTPTKLPYLYIYIYISWELTREIISNLFLIDNVIYITRYRPIEWCSYGGVCSRYTMKGESCIT